MATIQVIEQGPRNYTIKVDGAGGDAAVLIVDPLALNPPCTRVHLMCVEYSLAPSGTADLFWDATTPVSILHLYGGSDNVTDFLWIGGLPNNAGAGITGKVTLNTNANPYTLVLKFTKKDPYLAS